MFIQNSTCICVCIYVIEGKDVFLQIIGPLKKKPQIKEVKLLISLMIPYHCRSIQAACFAFPFLSISHCLSVLPFLPPSFLHFFPFFFCFLNTFLLFSQRWQFQYVYSEFSCVLSKCILIICKCFKFICDSVLLYLSLLFRFYLELYVWDPAMLFCYMCVYSLLLTVICASISQSAFWVMGTQISRSFFFTTTQDTTLNIPINAPFWTCVRNSAL